MQSAKEKISDLASSAKEHAEIYKAKVDEKVEKSTARTKEEKKIAEERRKAREAEAKMEMHEAKAMHAAEKLDHKARHYPLHAHHHGTAATAVDPRAAALAGTGTHGYIHDPLHAHHHGTATTAVDPRAAALAGRGTRGHVIHQQPPVGTLNPLESQYPNNQYL